MKIAVVGVCSTPGIAFSMKQMLPEAHVRGFEAVAVEREKLHDEALAYLQTCDLVFSHYLPAAFGGLATEALEAAVSGRFRRISHFVFTGLHPDIVHLKSPDGQSVVSPLGAYNSQIVAASYAEGVPVEQVAASFREDVFRALGYFAEYGKAKAFALRTFSTAGLDIAAAFARWERRGVFMYTNNHPKSFVVFDLAAQLLKAERLIDDAPDAEIHVADPLSTHAAWPLYPALAQALSQSGGGYLFKTPGFPNGATGHAPLLNLGEFIAASYALYAKSAPGAFDTPALASARAVLKQA